MLSRAITLRCFLSACCIGLAWPATASAQARRRLPPPTRSRSRSSSCRRRSRRKRSRARSRASSGVPVKATTRPSPKGLAIAVKWRRVTVSFINDGGERTTRSLDLPADRAQSLEIIALLAGNLARDEAGELLARLTPPEPPPEPPAPPPSETSETAPAPAEKAVAPAKKEEDAPEAARPRRRAQGLPPPPKLPPPPAPAPPPDLAKLIRDENASFNLSLWYPTTLLSETERRVITRRARARLQPHRRARGRGAHVRLLCASSSTTSASRRPSAGTAWTVKCWACRWV